MSDPNNVPLPQQPEANGTPTPQSRTAVWRTGPGAALTAGAARLTDSRHTVSLLRPRTLMARPYQPYGQPAPDANTCTVNRHRRTVFCFNVCSTGSAVFFRSVG